MRTGARWAGYVAFAVVFAVACGFLADWQFTRNADREEQLTLIAANYDAAPVPLAELVAADGEFDPADQWHPVVLEGQYLPDEQLLVRNRPHGGTSAFEVLVPFRLDDGRVLVVDRGWVPPGENSPDPDAVPDPPTGEATVIVRLQPGEPLPRSGRTAPEGQVPTIHLPLIAETIASGDATMTDVYGLMVSESPAPATQPSALASPSEDPGPHLSYAIQWILFAVMGFVFIWYMIRTERRHRREDAEDGDGRPRVPREKRRRDRDMQEEDALLDAVTPR
ncbi:SURF1 family protein [Microbacterium sp. LjRoot45]|uniref:SURF1 family cytochrome oxidase biogenesis protein n=1 Tax=Microbacterium sp. LjRoot45 TaxID=3342329 RepID=UPI003ED0DA39